MYDVKGNITRAGAEQVIREGGTVHMRGKEYRTLQSLPTEAEFAVGDPEATQKALDGLAAQRAQLDEQEKKLLAANAQNEQAKKDAEKAQKEREQREAADRKAKEHADSAAGRLQAERQAAEEADTHRRGRKGE